MDNLEVSVIVPLYNASKYILKTLDSIISQDFHSYEIIIVDDGSTDNSLEIAQNYLKDCEIPNKIIHHENHGVGYTRNIGLENSLGKYIVFVDDDDIIAKNHLSCLHKSLKNHDASFTKMLKMDDNGNIIEDISIYGAINDLSEITAEDLIKLELIMALRFSFCQIMYNKELLDVKFNTESVYGEDSEFALKNLANIKSLGICPDATYFYRQRSDSAISKASLKRFDFIKTLEDIGDYFENPELANLVKTNRIPKAIFGNMLYFFYNGYSYDEVIAVMNDLDLFSKLKNFKGDFKFAFKVRLFLLNPKLYYKMWKKFKNSI